MGNLIAPVRVKPTNVSQNDMDERIHHLQSMIYVTHSNRIITYSQKNPDSSTTLPVSSPNAIVLRTSTLGSYASSCQTRPVTMSPSELVE